MFLLAPVVPEIELIFQLAPVLLGILVIGLFIRLLIKIRYQLFEMLIGFFNPIFWVGAFILKLLFRWIWKD